MITNSIEIRFKKSTSKLYKEVLRSCRHFSGFEEGDPNILVIPDADSLYSQWEEFNHIFHTVKRWAGCTVLYNGKPLAPYKNLSDWFYSIQDIYYCYFRNYKRSYDKQNYCKDGGCWGCMKLKSIVRYIQPTFFPLNYWYNYGSFISDNVWKINKDQIRMILLEEAYQKRLEICPQFSNDIIEPLINRLPNTLFIDNFNWKIRYTSDYLENGPVDIREGIEHMELERRVYPIVRSLQDEVIPFETSPEKDVDLNKLTDKDADRLIDEYLTNKKKTL